ncbi:uncharacterized protein LOC143620261 [Bidens hawaiensis]|uniref:uncharacterized protein LOC143620261 n=1 Tax=Bidens hawaiensis TaxID=980011 RepID=UPI004048FEDD
MIAFSATLALVLEDKVTWIAAPLVVVMCVPVGLFVWLQYPLLIELIERGNQREKDRERAQARNGGKAKGKDDGLTPEQRRERDGKALQEKAAKKAEKAAAGSGGDAGGKKSTKK